MLTSVTPSPGIKSAAILEIFPDTLSNTSALATDTARTV